MSMKNLTKASNYSESVINIWYSDLNINLNYKKNCLGLGA